MTEIVKQEEVEVEIPDDETITVRKEVLAEFIIKDRNQYLRAQQERYHSMNEIQKVNMRYLFFIGIWVLLVSILLIINIAKIVATQDVWAMFMGILNVLTLFVFAAGIEEAMHWWDEYEDKTGGYLADTETD